jgi:hypothetical protein
LEKSISETTTLQGETTEDRPEQPVMERPKKPDSRLRATATAFIPEWAGSIPFAKPETLEELAIDAGEQHGFPAAEMLYPNCPPIGSQNALKLVMPYNEFDPRLYRDAFDSNVERINYDGSQSDVHNFTLVQRLYRDHRVVGNNDYKVQIQDPASQTCPPQPPRKRYESPALRSYQDELSLRLLKAQLQEQMRGPMLQAAEGPGPYLHTMQTPQPMVESMWTPPIGPGHPYDGRNALPSVRAREWDEIATAIKLLNLNYHDRQRRTGFQCNYNQQPYWEPPIPMGFEKRAKFNQPGPRAPLRGGGGGGPCECGSETCNGAPVTSEWDWTRVRASGCAYCGDDRHSTIFCELLLLHGVKEKVRCMSCGVTGHFLRDCTAPPRFDDEDPRSKKLVYYAHSAHWRQTLAQQQARFSRNLVEAKMPPTPTPAPATPPDSRSRSGSGAAATAACNDERSGVDEKADSVAGDDGDSSTVAAPEAASAPAGVVGDASVAFAALPCPSCRPEWHWDGVEENVAMVGALCQRQTQNGYAEDADGCCCYDGDGLSTADKRSRCAPTEANGHGRNRGASETATAETTPKRTFATPKSECSDSYSARRRTDPSSTTSQKSTTTCEETTALPPAFWREPNWVVETRNCPVMWNVMHKGDPARCWAIFNPLGSVAVDAFWRTAMAAMGWDAPALPDGEEL